jgi:hypothetical protein
MFGLSSKRISGQKKSGSKSTFRPQLEALETREVLSTSSAALHAVSSGPPISIDDRGGQSDFYINLSTHLLKLNTQVLNGKPNTPSAVQALSAGHDPDGSPDVFVTAGDGSFWKYNSGVVGGSWSKLLGPGKVKSFAAVDDGHVYAIFADNTLHEYIGSNWFQVPNSGKVKALDAVTDKFGYDAIFVLNTDNSFGEIYTVPPPQHLPGPQVTARTPSVIVQPPPGGIVNPPPTVYTELASPGFIRHPNGTVSTFPAVRSFSAGTDLNGKADVYAQWWTGGLLKNVGDSPNGWSTVAAAGTFSLFSATDSGAVWVIGTDNTPYGVDPTALYEYDAFGNKQNDRGFTASLSISAASSTDVYFVDTSHDIGEFAYDPADMVWVSYSVNGNGPALT